MAEQVLRLFPSASLRRDGPGSIRYGGKPLSEPEFEMVKPFSGMATAAVVISITEASPTRSTHDILQEPPKAHLATVNSRAISPSPSNIELPPSPSDSRADTPAPADSSPVLPTSSSTSEHNKGTSPTSLHSPVMRSMFPRFDPTISLQQQRYYPTIEKGNSHIPDAAMTRAQYSPSCYSQPETIQSNKTGYIRPKTPKIQTTLSTIPPPPDPEPEFSSPSDLLDLWSLANGQGLDTPASTYTLQLECTSLAPSLESIHLLSSLSTPLYTLTASPITPTHTITRTHPTAPHPTPLTIAQPTLLPLGPTQPLLATIFPAMAELMALDQSSSVAVTYKLDRATSGELQAEALVRAKAREGCELFWDSDSEKWWLVHPTLRNGEATRFEFAVENDARTGELGRISILAPAAASPVCQTSTGPSTTQQQAPLLTLSLPTLALTINAPLIAALPSLYILDSLLSALLTLLLHLHRSASDAPTPHALSPHPHTRSPRHHSLLSTPTANMTFAPPPTVARTTGARPGKGSGTGKTNRPREPKRSWFGKSRRPADAPSIVHPDADLEIAVLPPSHSSHLQLQTPRTFPSHPSSFHPTINLDDPRLPKPTRAVLTLLYAAFAAAVWILAVLVNVLAAGVVACGWVVRKL